MEIFHELKAPLYKKVMFINKKLPFFKNAICCFTEVILILTTILLGNVIPILQIVKLRLRKAELCAQALFSVSYQGHYISFFLLL